MDKTKHSLEELISAVEGKPFEEVSPLIQQRLVEVIAHAHQQQSIHKLEFSQEGQRILEYGYYHAIQWYRTASPRKLGGSYFLHPDEAFQIALEAGITDVTTLLTILYHDAIEEKIDAEQRNHKTEEKRIQEYLRQLCTSQLVPDLVSLSANFFERPISGKTIGELSIDLWETLHLLTRGSNELYYKSIGHVFAPRHKIRKQENIERAIIAKFCDRVANTRDLERWESAKRRSDSISYTMIISAFQQNDKALLDVIEDTTKQMARQHPEPLPGEFTGQQRLYQCFKNIILMNRYRERKLKEGKPVAAVAHLHLAGATRAETEIILNHLCTYHCGDATLNPRKVYEIYQQLQAYEQAGGLHKVTDAILARGQPSGFDGTLKYFFDARVRGDNKALEALYEDRSLMLKVAVAFHRIAELYIEQPGYYMTGLTQTGLKPKAPVAQ